MQRTLRRFFGLRENPFHVTPDPRFLVLTDHMRRTLAELTYAVEARKGLVVLTGEVGTGKTLLVRHLLDYIRRAEIPHALIFNPHVDVNNFFSLVLPEFGITPRPNVSPVAQLRQWLAVPATGNHDNAVLIVDEAQGLRLEVLEEIRLLSNSDPAKSKSFQVILAGQPELDEKLKRPEFRAIRNRISIRCTTRPLSRAEVDLYIAGRLKAAGASAEIAFPSEAANLLYFYSRGIPRLLNVLCEHSLLRAYSSRLKTVSAELVEEVAHRLQVDDLRPLSAYIQIPPISVPGATRYEEQPHGRAESRVEAPLTPPLGALPKVVPIDKTLNSFELPAPFTEAAMSAAQMENAEASAEVRLPETVEQEIAIPAEVAFVDTKFSVEEHVRSESELLDELLSAAVMNPVAKTSAAAVVSAPAAAGPTPPEPSDEFAVVRKRVDLDEMRAAVIGALARVGSSLRRAAETSARLGKSSASAARDFVTTRSAQFANSSASRARSSVARVSSAIGAQLQSAQLAKTSAASRAKTSTERASRAVAMRSAAAWNAACRSARSFGNHSEKTLDTLWRSASPYFESAATIVRREFAKLPQGPFCLQHYDAVCRWLQEPMQIGRMRRVISHKQA